MYRRRVSTLRWRRRAGTGYRYPKADVTQSRLRTGASQRWRLTSMSPPWRERSPGGDSLIDTVSLEGGAVTRELSSRGQPGSSDPPQLPVWGRNVQLRRWIQTVFLTEAPPAP